MQDYIILDYDGTIHDTMRIYKEAYNMFRCFIFFGAKFRTYTQQTTYPARSGTA